MPHCRWDLVFENNKHVLYVFRKYTISISASTRISCFLNFLLSFSFFLYFQVFSPRILIGSPRHHTTIVYLSDCCKLCLALYEFEERAVIAEKIYQKTSREATPGESEWNAWLTKAYTQILHSCSQYATVNSRRLTRIYKTVDMIIWHVWRSMCL